MSFNEWFEEHYGNITDDKEALAILRDATESAWMAGLHTIKQQLEGIGATIPAPPPSGTVESAMNHGLCIALCLVKNEHDSLLTIDF